MAYSRLLNSEDQRMRKVKDQDERGKGQGIKRTQRPEDQGTRGPRDVARRCSNKMKPEARHTFLSRSIILLLNDGCPRDEIQGCRNGSKGN